MRMGCLFFSVSKVGVGLRHPRSCLHGVAHWVSAGRARLDQGFPFTSELRMGMGMQMGMEMGMEMGIFLIIFFRYGDGDGDGYGDGYVYGFIFFLF